MIKKHIYIIAIAFTSIFVFSCNKSEDKDVINEISTEETSSIADEQESDVANTLSNNNVDKMLDDYEEYVDRFLIYLQKANTGDIKALEEYPAIMEKAEDLEKSMEASQDTDEWTAEQMKRMMEIQTKMLTTSANM